MASTQSHLARTPPRSGETAQPRAQALGNLNILNQSPEWATQPALVNIRRLPAPMARLQGRGATPSTMGTLNGVLCDMAAFSSERANPKPKTEDLTPEII